jgi:hypothetical protein
LKSILKPPSKQLLPTPQNPAAAVTTVPKAPPPPKALPKQGNPPVSGAKPHSKVVKKPPAKPVPPAAIKPPAQLGSDSSASGSDSASSEDESDESSDEFEVEKILRKRVERGRAMYLVKWKGYSNTENTWEPASNMNCPDLIKAFEENEQKKQQEPEEAPKLLVPPSMLLSKKRPGEFCTRLPRDIYCTHSCIVVS